MVMGNSKKIVWLSFAILLKLRNARKILVFYSSEVV